MVGASLFYGDAIITPAISVLSAVEGLKLVTPAFEPYVVPLSLVILIGLFAVQSFGTGAAWRPCFGPITAFWFLVMALGGLIHILDDPSILAAINPVHGLSFLLNHGTAGLLALGAVFLSVTGAEALYADMGHFGARRSGPPGSASSCRRWRSTISARAPCCWPIPRGWRTRSSCSIPPGRCCRW